VEIFNQTGNELLFGIGYHNSVVSPTEKFNVGLSSFNFQKKVSLQRQVSYFVV
jgi:hypothetical protein